MSFVSAVCSEEGSVRRFCFRSGLLVYEETLSGGRLTAAGRNAAGYPLNVLQNYPTRIAAENYAEPGAFRMEICGADPEGSWEFRNFQTEKTDTGIHALLTLESTLFPVRLYVHTLLDGTQMMARELEVENLSGQPLPMGRFMILGGPAEEMRPSLLTRESDTSRYYSAGYFTEDGWGKEGQFAWQPVTAGTRVISGRFGADRYRHPLLMIRNNLMGTVLFFQTEWSGGYEYRVTLNTAEQGTALQVDCGITGHMPQLVLRPGERFSLPRVHAGLIHGDTDACVNEMHAHARLSVLNRPEADGSACLIGCGMGAEHDMSVECTRACIRQFAEMGGEVFIIDAGWECPPAMPIEWQAYNGMNRPDPLRYPGDSFAELCDECHAAGLKFGLWAEIERLGEKVLPLHPDWIAPDVTGGTDSGFLDLTRPDAYAWAESELTRIITEYRLDLLRVDYNVNCRDYFRMRDTGGGMREDLSLRHFSAVYKLYSELKERFPQVIFENCAGGGGRTDWGQMRAFHHTWVSDWQNLPRALSVTNGMTMALPPERVDRLFAGMGGHAFGSLQAQMRNTMLGHMSLNIIAPMGMEPGEDAMAFVRHSVKLYKEFIRPLLPGCRVYHSTAEGGEKEGFTALEISRPDGSAGAAAVFSLPLSEGKPVLLCLRGPVPGIRYRVYTDNSGAVFFADGLELRRGVETELPFSLDSELILYSRE